MKHQKVCNASICNCDQNKNYKKEVVWYPGEEVCQKTPYTKFQKKQLEINRDVKSGHFKHLDRCYTAHELETTSI